MNWVIFITFTICIIISTIVTVVIDYTVIGITLCIVILYILFLYLLYKNLPSIPPFVYEDERRI